MLRFGLILGPVVVLLAFMSACIPTEADGGGFGWIITIFTVVGVLSLLYVIALVILLVSPKTPNKGTILAFFGGPLVYIYVGKWGESNRLISYFLDNRRNCFIISLAVFND